MAGRTRPSRDRRGALIPAEKFGGAAGHEGKESSLPSEGNANLVDRRPGGSCRGQRSLSDQLCSERRLTHVDSAASLHVPQSRGGRVTILSHGGRLNCCSLPHAAR